MNKLISSLIFASFLASNPSYGYACPANIGEYSYESRGGGSFGHTINYIMSQRPDCICEMNMYRLRDWYSFNDMEEEYLQWKRECGK